MKYDIGITTFKHRFELFKNLVESIRQYNTESNIIVNVNGNTNSEFDEEYRSQLYDYLKSIPKTFLKIWPEYRSLSKQWNDCIITSTADNVIIIGDDALITSGEFFTDIEKGIDNHNEMFLINESFGYFVVNINQMYNLGYFDERLLAIGKEDSDMMRRYFEVYKTPIPSVQTNHIKHLESPIVQDDYQKWENTKYPLLNFIIYNDKINQKFDNFQQYPYEKFYRLNKHQIVNLTGIKYEF